MKVSGWYMKGIICYYSGSGNTKLACEFIKHNIENCEFELFDIVNDKNLNLKSYDIIGFAAFTDAWGVSKKFSDFIERLEKSNKYCFVFNTFGCISGKTIPMMKKLTAQKGFKVIAAHSLHCPENYPPMIVANNAFENSPNQSELNEFKQFIKELDMNILRIAEGKEPDKQKSAIKPVDYLPRVIAKVFGSISGKEFFLNRDICTGCGVCEKICPYNAISLASSAAIDNAKCHACWACYNHCPKKAIYTKKYKGAGQYTKPNESLTEKLKF